MRRIQRHALACVACVALLVPLLHGCSKRHRLPTAPPATELPPHVTAVSPAPRRTLVPYDSTAIWAAFDQDLDTTTVDTLHVFLKLDTRRIPILVSWDAPERRIRVAPLPTLDLNTTYTVVLSPTLRTASGVELGTAFSWQFTTNTLRRPSNPGPADRAGRVTPYSLLSWGGNELLGGNVRYELSVGRDSAAIAARQITPLALAPSVWLPLARWWQDGPVFWSVTAIHLVSGERLNGPVWRFDTPAPGTSIDSLDVAYLDWGCQNQPKTAGGCGTLSLWSGAPYICTVRWNLATLPAGLCLAGAKVEMTPQPGYTDSASAGESIWSVRDTWICSKILYPGPPFANEGDGPLATSGLVDGRLVQFSSDKLGVQLEAMRTRPVYYGFIFRSSKRVLHYSPGAATGRPLLRLYTYVFPSGASRAAH